MPQIAPGEGPPSDPGLIRPASSASASAVRSATASGVRGPTASHAGEDPEVAFGRYLIGQGLISPDQAREAYKLLVNYRQKFPQVNLSQVLAKHGMADKDRLRVAYQGFHAQSPSSSRAGSSSGSGFFPAPGGVAGSGSSSSERFGFKTAELDPGSSGGGPPIPATIDPDAVPGSPFASVRAPGRSGSGQFAPVPSTIDPDAAPPPGSPFASVRASGSGMFAQPMVPDTIDPDAGMLGSRGGSGIQGGGMFGVPATIDPDAGMFGSNPGTNPWGSPAGSGAFGVPATIDPDAGMFGSNPGTNPYGGPAGSGAFGVPATIDPDAIPMGPGGIPNTLDPDGAPLGLGGIPNTLDPDGAPFGLGGIPNTLDPDGAPLGLGGIPNTIDPDGGDMPVIPHTIDPEAGTLLERGPRGTHAGPRGTHRGPRGTHAQSRGSQAGPRGTHPQASTRGSHAGPHGTHALGPHGTHRGPRGTHGPGGTHPQASSRGSRGTHAGPRGSGAGPRGTHRERGGGIAEPGIDPFAQPLEIKPQGSAELSHEDEHEDTDIQSSTGGGTKTKKRKQREQLAGPKKKPVAPIAAAAVGVVVLLCGGVFMILRSERNKAEKGRFMEALKSQPLDRLAELAKGLPAAVLSDPEVEAKIKEINEKLEKAKRRQNALEILERLQRVTKLEERLQVCEEALAVDDTLGRAYVERARVKYALSKRNALAASSPNANELIKPALEDTLNAIRVEPDSPDAYLFQAQLFLASGDRTSALTALKRVQDLDPESALGQLAFGLQEEVNRRWDQAIAHYDKAIERNVTLVEGYLGRARARIQKSEYARALSDAKEALRRDQTSSEALTLQAEARYYASGRSDRTGPLGDLNAALKLDPSNGHSLALRAYTRLERESTGRVTSSESDLKQAEQDALAALRVDPEEWLADAALAEIADARKQKSMPLTHATKAVEKSKHPDAYLLRGRLRAKDGDDDNSSSDFDWVLRLTENLPGYGRTRARALTNKAAIHIKRRELTEAKQKLEKALELDNNLPEAYFNRGLARYYDYEARHQQSDLQQALMDFSEALNRKQALGDAYFYRALGYIDSGRYDEALKDLEQGEALVQEGEGFFNIRQVDFYRGVAYMRKEEKERALELFKKFVEVSNPGDKAHPQAKEWIRELERELNPAQPTDGGTPEPPPPSGE